MKGQNKAPKYTINYTKSNGLNVRLRGKVLSSGKISLYLDYYQGYSKNNDGNIKTSRKLEFLKIYLHNKPKTEDQRKVNKEYLELAQSIRSKRESDILHKAEGLVSPQRKKTNFLDFCHEYENTYQKKDIRMIKIAIQQFKHYTGETYLKLNTIDKKLIIGFKDHLLKTYNGETPNSIFSRFKKILNSAVDEGLFVKSPADKISCPKPDGISKEILMPDEIISLSKTECGNAEIKRAFLFSLNTGLRFVDIADLQYKHIKNDMLIKSQQKTGKKITMDLNQNAKNLLFSNNQHDNEDYIFHLPSLTSCLKTLKIWARNAGINKNITWHSARHSFGTILLMNKTDIKTVSSLLGHSKLEHTQKYTHLVDELKKKAVDTLPKI